MLSLIDRTSKLVDEDSFLVDVSESSVNPFEMKNPAATSRMSQSFKNGNNKHEQEGWIPY